ncbi:MAG: hypothetical protein WBE61_07085 [Nitrososphaeraceae archaeon]
MSISNLIKDLFKFIEATAEDPIPTNGSTTSFTFPRSLIHISGSFVGNGDGCGLSSNLRIV